ncbi:MAG TPA: hypothetical protein VGG35_09510 [Streptosporangiaceae bacterium]
MLPLPTLLSQVLVAFTIEADNELEHRMPHRSTLTKGAGRQHGPWLTSLPMWANFLRLVPPEGVPLAAVAGHADITNLAGLERWGYVQLSPAAGGRAARRDQLVRLSRGGQLACRAWKPVPALIEERWRDRFGAAAAGELRAALEPLEQAAGAGLPRYLPVVTQGMFARVPDAAEDPAAGERASGSQAAGEPGSAAGDLSVLLARVLLALTLDYERDTRLSLTMNAGVLRVITAGGVRLRDVPGLAGVSKEAVAMVTGYLARHDCLTTGPGPEKVTRLTPRGERAVAGYRRRVATVEEQWAARFGAAATGRLRDALAAVLTATAGGEQLLAAGLRPYPDGWRAQRPYLARTTALLADPAARLPHHPMVLHRGGYPDGS